MRWIGMQGAPAVLPLLIVGAGVACGVEPVDRSMHALGNAGIVAPSEDEIVFENVLILEAVDEDAAEAGVNWAVRYDTCDRGTNSVAGNVDGFADEYDWEDGHFLATLDITMWDAGSYCFVFNPVEGSRYTQWLYIVDEFAVFGGTIGMGKTMNPRRGKSPTHAFEGVIGVAGSAGTVGEVRINYRELGTECTFTPGAFAVTDYDPGIELDGLRGDATGWDGICTNTDVTSSANIFLLDRDAESNRDAPRGGIVVRWLGYPSMSDYEIDGTPAETGPDSWVPFERGNVHVGVR